LCPEDEFFTPQDELYGTELMETVNAGVLFVNFITFVAVITE